MFVKTRVKAWLERNCGAFFSSGEDPIYKICSIDNCFVLNTSCLPFWNREKNIIVSTNPIKPFEQLKLIKAFAYDDTSINCKHIDGSIKDSESLYIQLAFWDEEKNRYLLLQVDYLPDTKKTFGSSLGGYPETIDELEETWNFRIDICQNDQSKPVFDVFSHISKPSWLDKTKYNLGLRLYRWVNRVGMPSYADWIEEIKQIAKNKNVVEEYRFKACRAEYWNRLYLDGFKAREAFGIGTNPENWE